MSERPRRAWILGAGFTYPLGAPLFADLFSDAYRHLGNHLLERFSEDDFDRMKRVAFRTSAAKTYDAGRNRGFWSNPEQFLQVANDCLSSRSESVMWHTLHEMTRQNFPENHPALVNVKQMRSAPGKKDSDAIFVQGVLDGAREMLATDVSMFLFGADMSSERWLPYCRWASLLTPLDTIITFNYDEAVERVVEHVWGKDEIQISVPGRGIKRHFLTLHKLHGSVSWKVHKEDGNNGGNVESCVEPLDFLKDFDYRPHIFAPGPEKQLFAKNSSAWLSAMEDIEYADEISMIGYRFPETDMFALDSILKSLRKSRATSVKVVLGPRVGEPHIQRVKAMLDTAVTCAEVVPMYAQDYLATYGEERQREANLY